MSLFSKFLLLLLVILAGYILWPRHPSLHSFTPEKIAALETQAWQALRSNNQNQALLAYYQILDFQFQIPPITAFNAAKLLSSTLSTLLQTTNEKQQDLLAPKFVEFYTILKRETNAPFDPSLLGNDDHTAWILIASKAPSNRLQNEVLRVLSGLSSTTPDHCTEAAAARTTALKTAFLTPSPDWSSVQQNLTVSWQKLASLKTNSAQE